MSKLGLVTSSAIIVLGISALPASTAEQTLKQQIQGAWNLVSCDAKGPVCANPGGSLSLNGNGRYTIVVTPTGRAKIAEVVSRQNVTPADYKVSRENITPGQFHLASVQVTV
jgi:hypothetical protein